MRSHIVTLGPYRFLSENVFIDTHHPYSTDTVDVAPLNLVKDKDVDKMYNFLSSASAYYPEFDFWWNDITKDVDNKISMRWVVSLCGNDGRYRGLAILKCGGDNGNKICIFKTSKDSPVWVSNKLMELCLTTIRSIESLDMFPNYRVIITVPEELHDEYSILLKRFGFDTHRIIKNRYRRGKNEYIWRVKQPIYPITDDTMDPWETRKLLGY